MDYAIKMTYRTLENSCLNNHPDRGGDGKFFQENWPLVKEARKKMETLGIDPRKFDFPHSPEQHITSTYTAEGILKPANMSGKYADVFM